MDYVRENNTKCIVDSLNKEFCGYQLINGGIYVKLKERKFEIIDTTLIELWKNNRSIVKKNTDKVKELIRLIYLVGCDFIEITEELCEVLFPLPNDVEFRLNYSKVFQIKSINDMEKLSKEIETNKIIKKIRIIGLDDSIFYDYENELLKIINKLGDKVELSIGDKYKCSTAIAIEWIKLGGKSIITSFAGIKGNTPLEELFGSLRFVENINIRGNSTLFPKLSQVFEEITGEAIAYNKAIIGRDIFNVESGIHVDGIEKDPKTFEPYNPIEIGRKRNVIIGKHSGVKSIKIKLQELNIQYKDEFLSYVLDEVRQESSKYERGLNDDEIIKIYEKVGGGCE